MRPKRLISLLVAVCMMITMLPLSAVTAFAADTASSIKHKINVGDYEYTYTVNEDGHTATITDFSGPDDGRFYYIDIPETLDKYTVTGIGKWAFYGCSALTEVTIPHSVTSIDKWAFDRSGLHTLTIEGPIESMGLAAFYECTKLETVSLGENIKTIGEQAFQGCSSLTKVTIPDSVTSIGEEAFYECTKLETISLGENIETIGRWAFTGCSALTNVTIPKNVTTIESGTFKKCSKLEYIILPAGLTSFQDSLEDCPAGNPNGAIYYKNYKAKADALLADNDNNSNIADNDKLKNRNFLYLCNVIFDAKGGNLADPAEVPVYKTEKITETKANDLTAIHDPTRAGYKFTGWYTEDGKDGKLFDVDETAITEDTTLYAHWAPVYHPLTVTGGTATVEKDGHPLVIDPVVTGDKKTYSVPEGAKVTVTLDKTAVLNGKVFDGWSTSLPTGQDYKAESITFTMSSGVNVSATYRDAAADHTPGTAVCHPLTVTGGIVTVKNGDKDVTDTLTVTTDETTGKKTYSVPEGAKVTVTLDKTLIPEGMVFDIWSTGKFSLPLGQDYKAETITFTMSSDVDIAAQYRDATIEDDGPGVLGTVAIIGTAAVGGAVLGYQAYSLGAEFAGKLMALPYFPSNRSALAMMLWEDAGKPMPESELLYPDVGQEERDMDLQHAARWAMENELIPDLNDEGTAPEEMKFFPANPVSKLDVLNAWQKAQELKNN